jgi:hypothetical protein
MPATLQVAAASPRGPPLIPTWSPKPPVTCADVQSAASPIPWRPHPPRRVPRGLASGGAKMERNPGELDGPLSSSQPTSSHPGAWAACRPALLGNRSRHQGGSRCVHATTCPPPTRPARPPAGSLVVASPGELDIRTPTPRLWEPLPHHGGPTLKQRRADAHPARRVPERIRPRWPAPHPDGDHGCVAVDEQSTGPAWPLDRAPHAHAGRRIGLPVIKGTFWRTGG